MRGKSSSEELLAGATLGKLFTQYQKMPGHLFTSTAGFGALRPTLQRPLKSVYFLLQDVVAVDGWHRVLVDDVFVGQAGSRVILPRDDLSTTKCQERHKRRAMIYSFAKQRNIRECFGVKGPSKLTASNPPSSEQGHLQLDGMATSFPWLKSEVSPWVAVQYSIWIHLPAQPPRRSRARRCGGFLCRLLCCTPTPRPGR